MMILSLILQLCPSAHAMTPEEIRAAIHAQASDRHPAPPADFWNNLGPEALPVLKSMLREENGNVVRTWIIDGLGHFHDPEVGRILESKIKESKNEVFTKKLLGSLIESQGNEAFDFVEPYLSSPDPHIRIVVARGIRTHMSSERATERLNRYLANEKDEWIRNRVAKAGPKAPGAASGRVVRIEASKEASALPGKDLEPLPEEKWAGEWKGVYLSPSGSGSAKGFLKKEKDGWKVELSFSKKRRIELKAAEMDLQHFQTDHAHWIRIRVKKTDTVFTGSRKAN